MKFEQRQSGLVVPRQKPKRTCGVLEIQDEDKRELATKALSMLWDAMEYIAGKWRSLDDNEELGIQKGDEITDEIATKADVEYLVIHQLKLKCRPSFKLSDFQ